MKKKVMGVNVRAIPGNYISLLVTELEKYGVSRTELIKKNGIKKSILDNPREWLDLVTFYRLVQYSYEKSKHEELGLTFGSTLSLPTHGYVGYAAMCCETLNQAIDIAVKYTKTRTPLIGTEFFIDEENQQGVIQLVTFMIFGKIRRFILEAAMSSFNQMHRFLLNNEIGDIEVRFKYAEPSYKDVYTKFFGKNVKFKQNANQYRIPLEQLTHRLPLPAPYAKKEALLQCEKELSRIQEQQDIITSIRLILLEKPGFIPDMDEVADRLHMSPRTMRRKLTLLNTSFREVSDNVREEVAIKYLEETTLTIEEISDLLGYSNPSNFSNAFKRWTGMIPSEIR